MPHIGLAFQKSILRYFIWSIAADQCTSEEEQDLECEQEEDDGSGVLVYVANCLTVRRQRILTLLDKRIISILHLHKNLKFKCSNTIGEQSSNMITQTYLINT